MAPTTHVESVPPTIDLSPSETTSSRRSGAMVVRPAIMIPRLPKLAKPHNAYSIISRELRELHVGDELVEDRFHAHEATRGDRLGPREPHQPAHRRHHVAQ